MATEKVSRKNLLNIYLPLRNWYQKKMITVLEQKAEGINQSYASKRRVTVRQIAVVSSGAHYRVPADLGWQLLHCNRGSEMTSINCVRADVHSWISVAHQTAAGDIKLLVTISRFSDCTFAFLIWFSGFFLEDLFKNLSNLKLHRRSFVVYCI